MKFTLFERFRCLLEDPYKRIEEVGVSRGQRVVDIGAGGGFFTVASAEVVGQDGVVYCVEPDHRKSERIRKRVEVEGLKNVVVLQNKVENLTVIKDGEVDVAFSFYSMHHFEDKERALSEIRRVLRNGGHLYIRDIIRGAIPGHGLRREDVKLLANAGFSKFELLGLGRGFLRAKLTK